MRSTNSRIHKHKCYKGKNIKTESLDKYYGWLIYKQQYNVMSQKQTQYCAIINKAHKKHSRFEY